MEQRSADYHRAAAARARRLRAEATTPWFKEHLENAIAQHEQIAARSRGRLSPTGMRCRHKTKPPRFQAKPPAIIPALHQIPIWDDPHLLRSERRRLLQPVPKVLSSGFVAFFGSRQPDGPAIEIRRDDRVLYDSPLEGGGFEPSVPGRETVKPPRGDEPSFLEKRADLFRNRRFEIHSLQRRVRRELGTVPSGSAPTSPACRMPGRAPVRKLDGCCFSIPRPRRAG